MVDKKEDLSLSSINSSKGGIRTPEDHHQLHKMVLRRNQTRPLSALEPHQQQYSLLKREKIGQQHLSTEWDPIMRRPYTLSTSSNNHLARHSMSSLTLHFSKFASLYQPQLEDYHHDNLSQKQIDRLSVQYSSSDTIQQLLQHTPSLTSKPYSLSSSSSSTTSTTSTQSNDLSSDAAIDDTNGKLATSSIQSQQAHQLPITPPMSSPNLSVRLSTSSATSFPATQRTSTLVSSPSSKSILPEEDFYYPIITHIQKNPGMRLRSFLCQSVVLAKTIRLEQRTLSIDARFFGGNNEQTGQAKAILKLSIVKLSSNLVDRSRMAPFGISFIHSARHFARENINQGGSTGKMNQYATIPDSLVLEALNVWLSHSHLPHISHASHIMRVGIKLYIVYDKSMIQ